MLLQIMSNISPQSCQTADRGVLERAAKIRFIEAITIINLEVRE